MSARSMNVFGADILVFMDLVALLVLEEWRTIAPIETWYERVTAHLSR